MDGEITHKPLICVCVTAILIGFSNYSNTTLMSIIYNRCNQLVTCKSISQRNVNCL